MFPQFLLRTLGALKLKLEMSICQENQAGVGGDMRVDGVDGDDGSDGDYPEAERRPKGVLNLQTQFSGQMATTQQVLNWTELNSAQLIALSLANWRTLFWI